MPPGNGFLCFSKEKGLRIQMAKIIFPMHKVLDVPSPYDYITLCSNHHFLIRVELNPLNEIKNLAKPPRTENHYIVISRRQIKSTNHYQHEAKNVHELHRNWTGSNDFGLVCN